MGYRVIKGHGTENDFVVLPDLDGAHPLTPALVTALCDRHAGIGADGVLRIVRSENDPESKAQALDAQFFMDYRNSDGSSAEMCGNGVRVVARYLQQAGLIDSAAAVATRGGVKQVRFEPNGDVTVGMGSAQLLPDRPAVRAYGGGWVSADALVLMPNPHVVVAVADEAALAELDLSRPPDCDPDRPDGQNVEFVVRRGARHLAMRVHERGAGETRSCGTGICAVVVAAATGDGAGADSSTWTVDVPGGRCTVRWRLDGEVELSGPAVLVAEIELDEAWLGGASS